MACLLQLLSSPPKRQGLAGSPSESGILLALAPGPCVGGRRYGSWGVCFTYAVWFGITGLVAAGARYKSSLALRKAVSFLLCKQLPGGGWGESYLSCQDKVRGTSLLPGLAVLLVRHGPGLCQGCAVLRVPWAVRLLCNGLRLWGGVLRVPYTLCPVPCGLRITGHMHHRPCPQPVLGPVTLGPM